MKNNIEKELNDLKNKIKNLENEQKLLLTSDNFLHSRLVSLLCDKKLQNIKRGLSELNIASEKGNSLSSFVLGLLYEFGDSVEPNMSKSIEYYLKSFIQGYSKGIYQIGRIYHLEKEFSKAIEFYEKAAAKKEPNSLINLGIIYEKGDGVIQDYSKAISILSKSRRL